MICIDGLCPRHQAGKATESIRYFRFRGGTLMMSRRMSPANTALKRLAMTSMCPFILSSVVGYSSPKHRTTKLQKSERSNASYSSTLRSSIEVLLVAGSEPGRKQLHHLMIFGSEAVCLRRLSVIAAFDLLHQAQQDLRGFQVGLGRAVDQLGGDRLALADLSAAAILSD